MVDHSVPDATVVGSVVTRTAVGPDGAGVVHAGVLVAWDEDRPLVAWVGVAVPVPWEELDDHIDELDDPLAGRVDAGAGPGAAPPAGPEG